MDYLNHIIQDFLIENSDFEDNYSGEGGAIGIHFNVLNLTGIIQKNYFLRNWAGSTESNFFFLNFTKLEEVFE